MVLQRNILAILCREKIEIGFTHCTHEGSRDLVLGVTRERFKPWIPDRPENV